MPLLQVSRNQLHGHYLEQSRLEVIYFKDILTRPLISKDRQNEISLQKHIPDVKHRSVVYSMRTCRNKPTHSIMSEGIYANTMVIVRRYLFTLYRLSPCPFLFSYFIFLLFTYLCFANIFEHYKMDTYRLLYYVIKYIFIQP